MRLYYNVGVKELRGDHLWREGCPGILEYNADDVIANVSFSAKLLLVCWTEISDQKKFK